jgi:hypothetical protein
MKLLLKRQIDSSKQAEREREIEEGLALAKRVDKLREVNATEEKRLKDYRDAAIQYVQGEINKLILEQELLIRDIKAKVEYRAELIKPLDNEWLEVKNAKAQNERERTDLYLDRESYKLKLNELQKEKEAIKKVVEQLKQRESDIISREKYKNNDSLSTDD